MDKHVSNIHYKYALAFLVALIIEILTGWWYRISDLAQLLSFGLSLSSLVLAVIAILQALVSGSSLSGIVGSITTSAGQVQAAAIQIGQATEQLLAHAAGITPALGAMSDRFEQAQKTMLEYFAAEARSVSGPAEAVDTNLRVDDNGMVENTGNLWARTTKGGSIAYYSCIIYLETHKSFKISEIMPNQDYVSIYIEGFVAGLRSSNMMDIQMDNNKYEVKGQGKINAKEYKDLIVKTYTNPKDPGYVKDFHEKIEKCDRYFSAPA